MKIITVSIIYLFSITCIGQVPLDSNKVNKLFKKKFSSYDLSKLWNDSEASSDEILGFVGGNYQRFQIHYFSITKDRTKQNSYLVKGKTKMENYICDFEGTIEVINVEEEVDDWSTKNGAPNFDTLRVGYINAKYSFKQNQKQKHSGVLEGELSTKFFLNKFYKVSEAELMGDNDSNNDFVGTWTSYNSDSKIKCNFGNYRISDSGDLDVGVGEFVPNEKYIKNGWEGYCFYCSEEEIEKHKSANNWWK